MVLFLFIVSGMMVIGGLERLIDEADLCVLTLPIWH